MEGVVYSPLNAYSYGSYSPKPRQQNWRQRSSHHQQQQQQQQGGGGGEGGDYLDNYKRAQLKAILSQVNPGLTPRLRKGNTREVGIQVNPKVDASVQCSLGPRTLPPRPGERSAAPAPAPAPPAPARFSRPAGLYSSVFQRRQVPQLQPEPEGREPGPGGAAAAGQPEPEPQGPGAAAPEPGDQETAQHTPGLQDSQDPRGGTEEQKFRFQFLEQKYGYYHCKDCNIRWESAYIWCISGTNKVYFKQFCRKCDKGYNPYRVEPILCQTCSKTRCTCPQKKRHIDPRRPHRQELCGRCRGKRLSCDNTYSYKYIV
ncbi:zygote arrest protein 1 [Callorhinchus milii]|uniref:zygote arrest protein 1 n=1 Tax=Callorhinchus milii TaxID=7868 RepID=UPI001C3F8A14|nr:zygote arrest protein 1 [Callorhinchus milii]